MRTKQVDHRDDEIVYYKYDDAENLSSMLKRVNWISGTVLVATPIMSILALLFLPLCWQTVTWSLIYYALTGLGITIGYHRMWSHKAFKAHWIIRFLLMLTGSGAVQGSIKWWSRNHRIHHRYTDTALDPYNARQGFFYSHFGWMLFYKDWNKLPRKPHFDITDLEADPLVEFQNKHYGSVSLFMAFVFPTLVAGLGWGDWLGGYFFAGVARLVFVHHATFCVNSLAHWLGDQPFAHDHTSRDHFITAFFTLGEGYHNFHHEFPQDYRNAIRWYQYDPTKWVIVIMYYLGLAYDLQMFGENEINMGQWQMLKSTFDKKSKNADGWIKPMDALPKMNSEDFDQGLKEGKKLVLNKTAVLDVSLLSPKEKSLNGILSDFIGKELSPQLEFTQTQKRLLDTIRVASLLTA